MDFPQRPSAVTTWSDVAEAEVKVSVHNHNKQKNNIDHVPAFFSKSAPLLLYLQLCYRQPRIFVIVAGMMEILPPASDPAGVRHFQPRLKPRLGGLVISPGGGSDHLPRDDRLQRRSRGARNSAFPSAPAGGTPGALCDHHPWKCHSRGAV